MTDGPVTPSSLLSEECDTSKISETKVDLSPLFYTEGTSSVSRDGPIAFTLSNIFTPEECQGLIALAEKETFATVPVNQGGTEVINEDVRSGMRVIWDDEEFVRKLWKRISHLMPPKVKGAGVVGLNERLRFLKYYHGQFFAPHTDGSYARPENKLEISLLTIQMYLNDGFEGGETTFLTPMKGWTRRQVPVKPETGMALVFAQDLTHEGSRVEKGVKYTVRTDVMYRYGVV